MAPFNCPCQPHEVISGVLYLDEKGRTSDAVLAMDHKMAAPRDAAERGQARRYAKAANGIVQSANCSSFLIPPVGEGEMGKLGAIQRGVWHYIENSPHNHRSQPCY
jgi:hypothetical protein